VADWFYDPAMLGVPYIPMRAELLHLKRYARTAKRGRGFTACPVNRTLLLQTLLR